MKIDKVAGGHVIQTSFNQASTKTATPPAVNETKKSTQFNANTAALNQAQRELAELPDVDMAKVNQVRNALVQGELSLDAHALSQAVMRFHVGHD